MVVASVPTLRFSADRGRLSKGTASAPTDVLKRNSVQGGAQYWRTDGAVDGVGSVIRSLELEEACFSRGECLYHGILKGKAARKRPPE